jgi:imidazole glycerol-phosphate synthase subunit HisF
MLKKRIIPCLLFKDWGIVKSVKFDELRRVGDPTTCARVFNMRNADELIFLDIMAGRENKEPNFTVIEEIANECFMPLTIGGGIRTIEHVDKLFQIGADKVALNTPVIKNPKLITEIAKKYGAQAVVVSIDAKKVGDGYKAFVGAGKEETEFTPEKLAKLAESYGAGEILLNSIDNDGMMEGYDIKLIKRVTSAINIPLIISGGCGKLQDFVDAIKEGNADAVCAASIFFWIGESIITAKNHMHKEGINVRLI